MVVAPENLQAPYELACKYMSQHQNWKRDSKSHLDVREKLVKQSSRLSRWGRANGFPTVPDFPTLSEFHPLLQDDEIHAQVREILEEIIQLHLSGPSQFRPGKEQPPARKPFSLMDFIKRRNSLVRGLGKDIEELTVLANQLSHLNTRLELLCPGSEVSWVTVDADDADWSLILSVAAMNSK